ncbi:MAG: ribonuclease P protein component [Verrucomicrobiota bacterium]
MHFSRQCRILKSAEFALVRQHGQWLPGRFFHLQVMERENQSSGSRLGLVVSRKVGSAVVRNRIKRRCRSLFQMLSPDLLRSLDVVVVAKRDLDQVSFSALENDFRKRLSRWILVADSR